MLTIHTDAATDPKSCKSGGGILISDGKKQEQISIILTETENHTAELATIIKTLELLQEREITETIMLYSDSQTAVNILDQNQTKNPNFAPYVRKFQELSTLFPLIILKWLPEKQNKGADNLARQGLVKAKKAASS